MTFDEKIIIERQLMEEAEEDEEQEIGPLLPPHKQ